jgi:GntR family transcriptional repressor for pyruvate dehydrogenase complex
MNTFRLKPVDRPRLHSSIAEQIMEAIRSSAMDPGDALPSERELASQLGVSRGSVREAVRVLEYAGVLEVRSGHGTFLVQDDGLDKPQSLRVRAASIGDYSPLDVVTARRALEPMCARLAAAHRNEADLAEMHARCDEQAERIAKNADPTAPDVGFHRTIARASHNPVLEALLDQTLRILEDPMWREYNASSQQTPGRPEQFLSQHVEIVSAIDARDPERAAAMMDVHLLTVERGFLSVA